jgi:hypothetical protein
VSGDADEKVARRMEEMKGVSRKWMEICHKAACDEEEARISTTNNETAADCAQ